MKTTETEIYEQVINSLSKMLKIKVDDIKSESRLKEDLGLDSVDFMELFTRMMEMRDLRGLEEEASKLKTVSDIVKFLKKN